MNESNGTTSLETHIKQKQTRECVQECLCICKCRRRCKCQMQVSIANAEKKARLNTQHTTCALYSIQCRCMYFVHQCCLFGTFVCLFCLFVCMYVVHRCCLFGTFVCLFVCFVCLGRLSGTWHGL